MRKLISAAVLLLAAAVSYAALHKDTHVAQGPKPNRPCTGDFCNEVIVSKIDWAPINARMAVLLATREPAHVGGIPVR
jgi:hypothetical protein